MVTETRREVTSVIITFSYEPFNKNDSCIYVHHWKTFKQVLGVALAADFLIGHAA